MAANDPSPVQSLARTLGREWPTINQARVDTDALRSKIAETLRNRLGRLDSDLDVVVFGSIARGEWTSGSDVDWTLLIDGQANPAHQQTAQEIRCALEEIRFQGKELPKPGQTGVFGSLAFSHDLVHLIGGDADSNQNTTRRILLLLESFPIRIHDENGLRAYERTIRGIVTRYLLNDANVQKVRSTIPRFLLNDIVRYWRTVCVDFAWKEWEQAGKKWALRNIKLRMSRKLLFVSGLLSIFACQNLAGDSPHDSARQEFVEDELLTLVYHPPLQLVALVLTRVGLQQQAGRFLDHYEHFLSAMNDEGQRQTLDQLAPSDAYESAQFLELRQLSHEYEKVIAEIFFDQDSPVSEFTRKYGVF